MRGDHGNIATLLIERGGKVMSKELELVELADSPLAGNVRIFTDYDPEWEIDPTNLLMMEKIGESITCSMFQELLPAQDRGPGSIIQCK